MIRWDTEQRASWIIGSMIWLPDGVTLDRIMGLPTIDGYFAAAEHRTKASYARRWRRIVVLAVICWAACGVLISSSRTPGTMMTACGRFPFSNVANLRASA